jgi:hypothetical protein
MRPTTNVPSKLRATRTNYNFLEAYEYKFDVCYEPFLKIVAPSLGLPNPTQLLLRRRHDLRTCIPGLEETLPTSDAITILFEIRFQTSRKWNSRDSSGLPIVNIRWFMEKWGGHCPALFQPRSFPRHLGKQQPDRWLVTHPRHTTNVIVTHQLGTCASVSPQGSRSVTLLPRTVIHSNVRVDPHTVTLV